MEWYDAYRVCMGSDAGGEKMERLSLYTQKLQGMLVGKGFAISEKKGLLDTVCEVLSQYKPRSARAKKLAEGIPAGPKLEPEEYAYLESCEKKLEELLAEECVLCGDIAVEKVDAPFDSAVEVAWTF